MPATNAERQAAWRQRQKDASGEADRLRALVADLEAELEQARESRNVTRCQSCGTALACPSCQRGDDWA